MTDMMRFPEAVRRDPAVETWLERQAGELGVVARAWFERMRRCGNDVRELMHDGHPTACVADAALGYVGVFRAHASVGFFLGAELADPKGLLEGAGKRMRHVKIRPGVGLDAAALDALIAAAYAGVKLRLAAEQDSRQAPTTAREGRRRPAR